MSGNSLSQRKAQLDKAEREHLEDVVAEMRERVEDNVRFQLTQANLDTRPSDDETLDDEIQQLVEAIELEAVDDTDWDEAFEEYIDGVGYTIINRLAALRCMEVRDFIGKEVTVFKQNGLTPAAETLVHEEFLLEDEAILAAYHNTCDELATEIEILFDRSSAYSLVDPDDDTFEELCGMLDEVPDEVWRADDVLGWVYEYYNVKLLDDLRRKGGREGLDPEDVPPANQFYTPHWVVRMLTDNSLGKLYLEGTGELQKVVDTQEALTPNERKNRPLSPDESPDIADFCTYLVPSDDAGEPTDFDHPSELRVIDPACGSGHFLLYAFDVLERIWRAETDLPAAEIPAKILQHNLYGVDLDMRACQLAAFNLYLKGRTRAESEETDGFEMPEIGIVCADASVAEIDGVEAVFEEVAGDNQQVATALKRILDAFEEVHGLGSLLDVRGTLSDLFEDDSDIGGTQLTLGDDPRENHTLGQVLHSLHEAVEQHRESESFLAQDLRSFVRLLDILAQDYDVALMNPPYGSKSRMPDSVQNYVKSNYRYYPNFYISFFEVCENITKSAGRIGMLVPRSFMFLDSFEEFRADFVGSRGGFDFLAELGIGVLDNATVRTVGTVVRRGEKSGSAGTFLRLHDLDSSKKENAFIDILSTETEGVERYFEVDLAEFGKIPRTPICYYTPEQVRDLYETETYVDANHAGADGTSEFNAIPGIQTSNDERFVRKHWENTNFDLFRPIAKGGTNAWIVPQITDTVEWGTEGKPIKRSSSSIRVRNEEFYGDTGLTWTFIKETGRRFGYFSGGLFSHTGFMLFPWGEKSLWTTMSILNSDLYHSLFLSQTIERNWNAGEIGAAPWIPALEEIPELEELAQKQYEVKLSERVFEPISPYYIGSPLAPRESNQVEFQYPHPYTSFAESELDIEVENIDSQLSISEAARQREGLRLEREQQLEEIFEEINSVLYDNLGIDSDVRQKIRNEIFLRTSEIPEDREVPDPESVPEVPENIDQQVKDLVHHFTMVAVREEPDGIIPLHKTADQPAMLDRIIDQFQAAYGEHAEDRLAEVDKILGAEAAGEEAYPNLRAFIADELFDYHVSRMANTPIIWRLSTVRLIADADGEGFGCFVDYHSLDAGLFDRLSNHYLEPRKADLRERRSAANRRRSDDSLSTSEQAAAAETYVRCASGLDQIAIFEDILQELGSTTEREFDDADRERVDELAPKVAAFRKSTRERVETLAELRERKGEAWFQDIFSANFWNAVDEWRDEWLDALADLEAACEAYAKPSDEAVEAHLADLFDYFSWRLKGSDHYSSTGILFMTYYFEREGADLLDDDGQPHDTLTDDERLLASLATGLEDPDIVDREYLEAIADEADDEDIEGPDDLPPLAEFKALAEEIDDRCQAVDKRVPSDWKDRALSEITTTGYDPNRKHGVEINITPLAEAEIVLKTVDKQVI